MIDDGVSPNWLDEAERLQRSMVAVVGLSPGAAGTDQVETGQKRETDLEWL